MSRTVPKLGEAAPGIEEQPRRLVMRWQKDKEGRLFCTWASEPDRKDEEQRK